MRSFELQEETPARTTYEMRKSRKLSIKTDGIGNSEKAKSMYQRIAKNTKAENKRLHG